MSICRHLRRKYSSISDDFSLQHNLGTAGHVFIRPKGVYCDRNSPLTLWVTTLYLLLTNSPLLDFYEFFYCSLGEYFGIFFLKFLKVGPNPPPLSNQWKLNKKLPTFLFCDLELPNSVQTLVLVIIHDL